MKSSFNHETGKPEYKGAMDVIVKVIRNEGFFSLWKGEQMLSILSNSRIVHCSERYGFDNSV